MKNSYNSEERSSNLILNDPRIRIDISPKKISKAHEHMDRCLPSFSRFMRDCKQSQLLWPLSNRGFAHMLSVLSLVFSFSCVLQRTHKLSVDEVQSVFSCAFGVMAKNHCLIQGHEVLPHVFF